MEAISHASTWASILNFVPELDEAIESADQSKVGKYAIGKKLGSGEVKLPLLRKQYVYIYSLARIRA